jgi:hypothetical protein
VEISGEIMYKTCCTCKLEKDINHYSKNKSKKDGYQNECKSCIQQYLKSKKNLMVLYKKQYYLENKETIKAKVSDWNIRNKKLKAAYMKQWGCENRDTISANTAKRHARKLKATPPWLTPEQLEQIKELYTCAQMFKLYTGEEYHVDHIVPLQGENVCGLHVPWNLQVIPAKENLSKSNKLQEDIL